jgi:hypothetical protein
MPSTTSGNPHDDPARTRKDTRAPSAGQTENLDELAEDLGLVPPQPKPREGQAMTGSDSHEPVTSAPAGLGELGESLGLVSQPAPEEVEAPADSGP